MDIEILSLHQLLVKYKGSLLCKLPRILPVIEEIVKY